MAIQRIAVVGAGQMGSGIAQVAAQSGLTVTLLDAVPGLAVKAHGKLGGSLQKLVEKGKITAEARQGILDRIQPGRRGWTAAPEPTWPSRPSSRRWSRRWSSSGSSTRCSRPTPSWPPTPAPSPSPRWPPRRSAPASSSGCTS